MTDEQIIEMANKKRVVAIHDKQDIIDFARLIEARTEELQQILRNAYEVWAGSEGIPEPETAAEAYVYQLLIEMRDEVKRGL